ncbi:MAG TPA: hypothetical protein VKM55_03675 [Candidatus Lokiarchaeia archaeon]|nr:hypothetical protein [Candidatus Lokiarchaeia archaeon]
MALLSRKKLYLDFSTSPESLAQIEQIKKKIKVTATMKMKAGKKMEIELRGTKEAIQEAMTMIRQILAS